MQNPGQTYYTGGDYQAIQSQMKPINDLLTSGQYRDIGSDVIPNYYNGSKSLEETVAAIKGTPLYNPSIGPQYNAGQGTKPLPTQAPGTPTGQGFNTPESMQNGINYLSEQGQAIKNALESAANAKGDALGSGVPTRTPVSAINTNSSGTPVNSDNFNFFDEYQKQFGSRPTGPTGVDTSGVNSATNDLNTANGNLSNIQNQILAEQNDILSKTAGKMRVNVNGQLRSVTAETAQALADAKAQVANATKNLSAQNAAVSLAMRVNQQSYSDAAASYDKNYADAFQSFQAQNTADSKEVTQGNAQIKAFLSTLKGVDPSEITPDVQAIINQSEAQAGLPQGYTAAMLKLQNQGIKPTTWKTTSNGVTSIYAEDKNGKSVLIQTVGTTGTGGVSPQDQKTITSFNNAVSNPSQLNKTTNPITREQFIRQLQTKFPNINQDDIARKVYETYPDQKSSDPSKPWWNIF